MSYHSLQSRKQIQSLINSYLKKPFLNYINRRLGIGPTLFFQIYKQTQDDFEIYAEMMKHVKLNFKDKKEAFDYRAKKRTEDIDNILTKLHRHDFTRYIDVGSDDCIITNAISDYLQLDNRNAFGLDVSDKCDNNAYVTYVSLVPFEHSKLFTKSNLDTFDIVSCFMVMHHMEDREFRIQELKELCKDQSIWIIREHDANDELIKMFIDIEHLIYEVFLSGVDLNEFVDTYYANYLSKKELELLMNSFGFVKVYESEVFGGPRYYYCAYELEK